MPSFGNLSKRLILFSLIFAQLGFLQLSMGSSERPENDLKIISGKDLVQGQIQSHSLDQPKLGTVLVFLSSRCPCSNGHLPTLKELSNQFNQKGFNFVGIHSNANESLIEAKEYFSKSGLNFPVIQDDNARIANQFGALKTPHVFIINPLRKILYSGGVDDSRVTEKAKRLYLKEALIAIQQGHEPKDKEVRVLGCEIQRP